jgi:hypothetical protein
MATRKVIFALSAAAVLAASQVAYAAHTGFRTVGPVGLSGLGGFRSSGVSNQRMYLNNGGADPFSHPVRAGTSGTSTTTGGAGRAGLPPLT